MSDIIATTQTWNDGITVNKAQGVNAYKTKSSGRFQSRSQPATQQVMDSVTAEATCKKIVAILALDAGFEGITASALETLTCALENYTQQMYTIAHSFSELAGRTKPNIHDLQQAFNDMNLNPASLESYVRKASKSSKRLVDKLLDAKPQRKKEKNIKLLDSDIEDNSDSDDDEPPAPSTSGAKITARTIVPDHLPPFPSKHSYKKTAVFVKRPTDPQKIRELNAEQSRLVESNLKKLMAAENKVAMAAAHKDGSTAAVPADMLIIKEEVETADSIDKHVLSKLEALPVVNYEFSRRQQQLNSSNREGGRRQHEFPVQGDSLGGALNGGGSSGNVSAASYKSEWRKERRKLRREQKTLGELEQNLSHKRVRQESAHNSHLRLVSMDVDL
ncbi:transcription initiation factor TFIID subunit 8 [Entomortierella beljakovae]|nr:transcription initiation factor TFIID subunit 8 [Entomortierella beljakovae]